MNTPSSSFPRAIGRRGLLWLCLAVGPAVLARDAASLPPVVVKTLPEAGVTNVATGDVELLVTFSKAMSTESWTWSEAWAGSTPEFLGRPRFDSRRRTCSVNVRLEPGRSYGFWLNSEKVQNFKDASGVPAVPYLLSFSTAGTPVTGAAEPPLAGTSPRDGLLNDSQRRVLAWTDRQFRGFFEMRTFDDWSSADRLALESQLLESLRGPVNRDYYRAINALGALRSTNALPVLRDLSFDRRDRNNRDRWMAVRALGLMADVTSVPEMIHLVYHGNVNTRWWAQISLVRMTGTNFGTDWKAWGDWWNRSGRQPAYDSQLIRWWNGQAEPEALAASLGEGDAKFLRDLPPAPDGGKREP